MKKKILSGLLVVCMLICMLPVVALAADQVTINGTPIDDGATVMGATLNGSTLTLNGVNAETISLPASVTTLVINGTNTLTYSSASTAISAAGDLNIQGSGSLTIEGEYTYGIDAKGVVDISSATVTIDMAEYAIRSQESVAVSTTTVPTPTWIYDFTKPTGKYLEGSTTPDVGIHASVFIGNNTYTPSLEQGYLTTTASGGDPYIVMNTDPSVDSNQMGYMVIKYNLSGIASTATAQLMHGGGQANSAWGANLTTWDWEVAGEWDVVTVPTSWRNDASGYRVNLLRLDFLDVGASGITFDVAYIAFFATQADADAYAAAEEKKIEVAAATGIPASRVYTVEGTTYTADTVISITGVQTEHTLGAVNVPGSQQIGRDTLYTIKNNAATLVHQETAQVPMQNYLLGLQSAPLNVSGQDSVGLLGWSRDGVNFTHIGYMAGSEAHLTAVNTSTTNTLDMGADNSVWGTNLHNLSPVGTKMWYDSGLVGALGGVSSARRFWVEIPTSTLKAGISQVQIIYSTDNGATYHGLDIVMFKLSNGALDYDYTDAQGNRYGELNKDLSINGVDTGLNLVTNGTQSWAVGGTAIPVTLSGTSYSHAAYSQTGYFAGTPYTINVKDVNGIGLDGATVKMYNAQGNVIARGTTVNGTTTLYGPCPGNYTFSVEGDFTTLSNLTATNYVVTAQADINANDITAVTIRNGATVIIPYYKDHTKSVEAAKNDYKLVVDNATLDANPATIQATYTPSVAFSGSSVTVGETFSLNIALKGCVYGAKVKVGATEYDVTYNKGAYIATVPGIAPQAVADQLTISVVSSYGTPSTTYSVKDNLVSLYNNASSSKTLKTLAADLLNYAAAAQTYTGYNTANLANAGGFNGTATNPDASDNLYNVVVGSTGIDSTFFTNASVYYDNTNKLAIAFHTEEAGVVVRMNGQTVAAQDITRVDDTNYYVFYTDTITASQFAKTFTFTLETAGGDTIETLTYSVNSYAYRMKDGQDANAALALALYRYGLSAKAYVQANS